MHEMIYEKLMDMAKAGQTTTYGEIAPLAELDMGSPADRDRISEILGEISTYGHKRGNPMLSAVVIKADTNMPGRGFFTLARELGLYRENNDIVFFARELTKVYEAWKVKD